MKQPRAEEAAPTTAGGCKHGRRAADIVLCLFRFHVHAIYSGSTNRIVIALLLLHANTYFPFSILVFKFKVSYVVRKVELRSRIWL